MTHLPAIINDLAVILLIAGITTLIFKRIHQPLVLGYIVAGIITGPNFNFLTISDSSNIQAWSEIGVIFLMFALGLEFSFYKLKSVGKTAFIATSISMGGMILLGYCTGMLFGWSHMNCIFLGCMLSMSSTTIIIKAFDDLKLRKQSFTELVFGMLIVEDIAGILIMVILSAFATTNADFSSSIIIFSIARLIFFLILWFVLGMYIIPSFYKKTEQLMNNETLIIVSIGLCLGMVALVTRAGFSAALGAFLMGSLIAEAPNAETIEKLLIPIKDLFGAVFFVSVGMMVNPIMLWNYILPIIILVLITIIGRMFFATIGVLASGHNLNTAIHSGFSLAQIGEFSFIIASLGLSLGVIGDFLYPVIVAVSVITTFTTPFSIKVSSRAYKLLTTLLPPWISKRIDRYTANSTIIYDNDPHWKELLKNYGSSMLIFITLLSAIAIFSKYYLEPYLLNTLKYSYSKLLTASFTFIAMAPILRAMLTNIADTSDLYTILWFKHRANRLPLLLLILFKMFVAISALYFIIHIILAFHGILSLFIILLIAYLISSSNWLMGKYLHIESHFLLNLSEKHMHQNRRLNNSKSDHTWFDENLSLAYYKVLESSPFVNKSLASLALREIYGFNILQIKNSKGEITELPGGDKIINCADILLIIGTHDRLTALDNANSKAKLKLCRLGMPQNLRQFMLNETSTKNITPFLSLAISIDKHSPLLGTSLKSAKMRYKWNCLVIGLERGVLTIANPNVSLIFEENDILWVLGKQPMLNALIKEGII